ncbi:MAG: PD-(D/E)XK nuclease family protein, partial [Verrucomicrobiota bacterium]
DLQLEFSFAEEAPAISEPAPPMQTHFIGWADSLLKSSVRFLCDGWQSGPLDLTGDLIVVPTLHSGRRLREGLAIAAAERDAAVLPPMTVTAEFLTDRSRNGGGDNVADYGTSLMAMTGVLLKMNLNEYRGLYPVDPPDRNLAWALRSAREMISVRDLLSKSGLTLEQAGQKLIAAEMEAYRWEELAKLEKEWVKALTKLGKADPLAAKVKAAQSGTLPDEVRRLLIIGCPDLSDVQVQALEHYQSQVETHLLIAAPEERAEGFDRWGRPTFEHWESQEIGIEDTAHTIHTASDPSDQARTAARLIEGHREAARAVAVGVPDSEVTSPMAEQLQGLQTGSFDPAGDPVRRHGIFYLLGRTHELLESGSFHAFQQLIRVPDWSGALRRGVEAKTGDKVGAERFLRDVDALAMKALPDTLSDARSAAKVHFKKSPALSEGLAWVQAWNKRFIEEDFGTVLIDYLSTVFEKRVFEERDDKQAAFADVASAILQGIDSVETAVQALPDQLKVSDKLELLMELIRDKPVYQERHVDDIDLEGWVELLWEDAPHLLLTGMNDHQVPESIIGHAFLPDAARQVLGLSTNDDRFARDAYSFSSMLESRRGDTGRVDLVFGRQSDAGDPLRPSRLLFQCPDEELADRTLLLFTKENENPPPLPWSLAFPLKPEPLPEDAKIFQSVSVTGFRDYLNCPFRFYLTHGRKMREDDFAKVEMNAMDFGNLIHDTMEAMAKHEEVAKSTDASVIGDFFCEEMDRRLTRDFGSALTTPILVQQESARNRLRWWAAQEAEQRRQGWQIEEAEAVIGDESSPLVIDGMNIRGRIDRIEWHPQFGYRVLDFKVKSPDKKSVADFHLWNIKRTESPEDFADWMLMDPVAEGKPKRRWVDLQLPLYRMAMELSHPGEKVAVGYVTLGSKPSDVRLDVWDDFDEATLDSARRCAKGVVENIRNHVFWPPNEKTWRSGVDELFFGDVLGSVASEAIE